MRSFDVVITLPTADRARAHAFARALDLDTPGELADDGVPEPLTLRLNERASVMYIPTGGFGWVTAGRPTADAGTAECLVSLALESPEQVDELMMRATAGGAQVAAAPERKPWGYIGTFADPDGHLWEAVAP